MNYRGKSILQLHPLGMAYIFLFTTLFDIALIYLLGGYIRMKRTWIFCHNHQQSHKLRDLLYGAIARWPIQHPSTSGSYLKFSSPAADATGYSPFLTVSEQREQIDTGRRQKFREKRLSHG
jgi:hypothetical protein